MTESGDKGAVTESGSIPGLYGGLSCTGTPGSGDCLLLGSMAWGDPSRHSIVWVESPLPRGFEGLFTA